MRTLLTAEAVLVAEMNRVRAPKRNCRTRGRGVKGQPTRRRILHVLRRRAGLGPVQIARLVGVSKGTVVHHLAVLAEHGLVVARTVRGRSAWFPATFRPSRMEATVALRPWRRRQIARAIVRTPGVVQKELTRRLGVSRKVFRENMNALVGQGWVVEATHWRYRRYYPTRRLRASADVLRRHDG